MEDEQDSVAMLYSQQIQAEIASNMLEQQLQLQKQNNIQQALVESTQAVDILTQLKELVRVQPEVESHPAINAVMEHFAKQCGTMTTSTALEDISLAAGRVSKDRAGLTLSYKFFQDIFDNEYKFSVLAKDIGKKIDSKGCKSTPVDGVGRLKFLNIEEVKTLAPADIVDLLQQVKEVSSNSVLKDHIDNLVDAVKVVIVKNNDLSEDAQKLDFNDANELQSCSSEIASILSEYNNTLMPVRYKEKPFTIKPLTVNDKNRLLFQIYNIVDSVDLEKGIVALIELSHRRDAGFVSQYTDTALRTIYDVLVKRSMIIEAALHYMQLCKN